MRLLPAVLGFTAIVVNLLLALFLLGVGVLASSDGTGAHIDLLPIEPESTPLALIGAGLLGIVFFVLAFKSSRLHRCFLVIWCTIVSLLLLAAGFRPGYRFDGEDHFRMGVWAFLGSLLLLFGAFLHWKRAREV